MKFRSYLFLLAAVAAVHCPAIWFLRDSWLDLNPYLAISLIFAPALALLPCAFLIED